jgi:sigma-E factor negative regulatory protein RseA
VPSCFGHGLPTDTTVRTVSNEATVIKPEQQTIIINEATQEQLKLAEEEINRLMLEHAQNASQNTQQGVLPYARVPESPEKQ